MLKKLTTLLFLIIPVLAIYAQRDIPFDGTVYTDIEKALKEPEKVRFLDLSKQKLEEIPAGVFELTNLEYLVLFKNKITVIPPEIGTLKKLRVLDISRNKIEVLPPEIGELTELRTLILNQNLIAALPPEIGNLKNLKSLDLWGNEIDELPVEISKLQETLEYLDLRVIYMSFEKQEAIINLLPETDIYFSNGCNCN